MVRKRVSKDKVVNKWGEELIRWMEKKSWGIMNMIKEGNKEGGTTGGKRNDN